jgi:hypothetical protein
MMIPKNKNPESNVIDDFDDDPLPDCLGVAEVLHLVLLQDGTKEELESHRRDPRSRCRLCATGASDEAYKAYLFDDDRSLVREFMAQAG